MFPWLTKNNGHLRVYEFWQTYTPPPNLPKITNPNKDYS